MLNLKLKTRKIIGKKVKELRNNEIIPAIIYGHGIDSINVQMPYLDFIKIYKQAGQSSLLDLEVDSGGKQIKKMKALVYDIQYNPVTSKISHVDFYKTKAGEKLKTEIELKFIGEAPAIKNLGGILAVVLDKIEVECLPEDLIHEIEVDMTGLSTFEDVIRIKDLSIPEKLKTLQDEESMVVQIERPKKDKPKEDEPKEDESKKIQ